MTRAIAILLSLTWALLLTAPRAHAEPASVEAAAESDEVYVGVPFRYTIVVTGSQSPQTPDISGVKDLTLTLVNSQDASSSFISIINGRRTETKTLKHVFEYQATAHTAGKLTIPTIPVTVEGQVRRSPAVIVNVVKPQESSDFKVVVTIDKARLYVGEPTTLRVTWYLRKNPRSAFITMDQTAGEFDFINPPPAPVTPQERHRFEIEFLGRTVSAIQNDDVDIDGLRYGAISIEQIIIPRRAGRLSVGPVTAACDVLTGRRPARGMFDDPFNDRSLTQRFVAASEALTIDVLALPEEGRPADFNGLVGQYRMTASAEPRKVHVGDPITLTLRVMGPPPLESVPEPALDRQPEITERFRISSEPAESRYEGAARVFTQTIRAQNDGVKEIPPIALSYFDVASGMYRAARTAAIPLEVTATREITAADAIGAASQLQSLGKEIESVAGGIAYNYETPDALATQRFDLLESVRSPLAIALLAAPMGAYLIAGGMALLKRRGEGDVEGRRRRRALGEARTALRHAGGSSIADPAAVAADVSRGVCGYVAAKFDRPAAGLTPGECARLLRERGSQDADVVRALLDRCDSARFAGLDKAEAGALRDEALALVSRLEGSLGKFR